MIGNENLPPPVRRIKARAAQLRAAGNAALARHLAAQVGREHVVLVEGARLGRTEQFTEVTFAEDQPEGQIQRVRILGAGDGRLLA